MFDDVGNEEIDLLARAFVHAATALGEALATKLAANDAELATKLTQALAQGERMLLALEFDQAAPAIRWMTVDDYQRMKRIMSIAGIGGKLH